MGSESHCIREGSQHGDLGNGSGGFFSCIFFGVQCLAGGSGGQNVSPGPFYNDSLGAFNVKASIGAASFPLPARFLTRIIIFTGIAFITSQRSHEEEACSISVFGTLQHQRKTHFLPKACLIFVCFGHFINLSISSEILWVVGLLPFTVIKVPVKFSCETVTSLPLTMEGL